MGLTPAAVSKSVGQLEARLGARLPDDYRHFLKTCNGAQLDYDIDVVMASGERELLGFSLFGVGEDAQWECNPEELEQARRRPGYPATGLLPIGRDGGASLLLLADLLARLLLAPAELPIGIVTALLGAPFFIYLLLRGRS